MPIQYGAYVYPKTDAGRVLAVVKGILAHVAAVSAALVIERAEGENRILICDVHGY